VEQENLGYARCHGWFFQRETYVIYYAFMIRQPAQTAQVARPVFSNVFRQKTGV
jgi:hypothetical protein